MAHIRGGQAVQPVTIYVPVPYHHLVKEYAGSRSISECQAYFELLKRPLRDLSYGRDPIQPEPDKAA